jgi:ribosomal protein S27AE
MFLLPVIVPGALITAGLLGDRLPRMDLVTFGAVLAAVAVLVGLWLYAIGRWEKRLVRKLREAAYRLCPRCGFGLAGHEGRCTCPECGTACDLETVQAAWRLFRPRITGGTT